MSEYQIGEKVLCLKKTLSGEEKIHEAIIIEITKLDSWIYWVHYCGRSSVWNEWVAAKNLLKDNQRNRELGFDFFVVPKKPDKIRDRGNQSQNLSIPVPDQSSIRNAEIDKAEGENLDTITSGKKSTPKFLLGKWTRPAYQVVISPRIEEFLVASTSNESSDSSISDLEETLPISEYLTDVAKRRSENIDTLVSGENTVFIKPEPEFTSLSETAGTSQHVRKTSPPQFLSKEPKKSPSHVEISTSADYDAIISGENKRHILKTESVDFSLSDNLNLCEDVRRTSTPKVILKKLSLAATEIEISTVNEGIFATASSMTRKWNQNSIRDVKLAPTTSVKPDSTISDQKTLYVESGSGDFPLSVGTSELKPSSPNTKPKYLGVRNSLTSKLASKAVNVPAFEDNLMYAEKKMKQNMENMKLKYDASESVTMNDVTVASKSSAVEVSKKNSREKKAKINTNNDADTVADSVQSHEKQGDEFEIRIKNLIKSFRFDDYHAVVEEHKLPQVPAEITVQDIVESYIAVKNSTSSSEIAKGILQKFNALLYKRLYECEKQHYYVIKNLFHENMPMSKLYGAFHLIRLSFKSNIFNRPKFHYDNDEIIWKREIMEFLEYLVENKASYLNLKEYYNDDNVSSSDDSL